MREEGVTEKTGWRGTARRALPTKIKWRLSHVRLAYWTAPNFGDLLSPLLIEHLFGLKVEYSGFGAADLLSLGSLLELMQECHNPNRPHVWGTGFIREGGPWDGPAINPHAVRGYLSLERVRHLTRKSIAVGDPGLLTAHAFPLEGFAQSASKISVVPHYVDYDSPEVSALRTERPDVNVIDVRDDPLLVVQQIAQSSLVLSSSLHGLIVADSYNVPNAWTPMSDKLVGGSYKFEDYYSVFGMYPQPLTLQDALANASAVRRSWRPRPGLNALQNDLLERFPGPNLAVSIPSRPSP